MEFPVLGSARAGDANNAGGRAQRAIAVAYGGKTPLSSTGGTPARGWAQLILRCTEDPPCLAKLGEERQPVDRVQAYLENHYNQEISLEQLAQIANLSSFHLN